MAYPASLTAVLPGGASARSPSPLVWSAPKDPATTQTYAVDASKTLAVLGGIINGPVTVVCTRGVNATTPTVSGSEIKVSLSGGEDGGYSTCQFEVPLSAGGVIRPVVYLRIQSGAQLVSGGVGSGTPGGTSGTGGATGGGGTTTPTPTPTPTTVTGSLGSVPSSATAGTTLSGVTFTLNGATSGSVAVLSGGTAVALVTVSGSSGAVPALTLPSAAGGYTVQLRTADGATVLWQSALTLNAPSAGGTGGGTTAPAPTPTAVSGSLSGVPSAATAGGTLSGVTYALSGATSGSVAILSGEAAVALATLSGASGTVPALTLPSTAGSYTVRLRGPDGGTLWQSALTINPASTGGGTTTPTPITGSLSGVPSSATAGTALSGVTYTLSGTTSGVVAIVSGGVVASSVSVSGASGTVPSMTLPSTAGTATVQLRDAVANVLWQATVTLNAASGGAVTPSATVSGPSAAAVVGQPATFFVDLTGTTSAYLALETTAGAASGSRVAVTGDGFVSITPGAAGTFVAAVYPTATGGARLGPATSAFTVAAAASTGGGTTAPAPTGSLAGVPASATAGTSLTGIAYTLANATSATVAVLSGSTTVSSTSVSGASGTVPALALPSAAGTVSVQLQSGGAVLWQTTVSITAAPSTGTTTPSATISGPSAAAVTGQTATFLVDLTNLSTAYVGLLSGGTPIGTRVAITGDGFVSIPMPATAGTYSACVYTAATGGTKLAETPTFPVSAPSAGGTGTGATTAPAGKYVTGIAAATDGSNKLIATFSDGTTSDLTAAVSGAVASTATPAQVVDFGPAVTSVIDGAVACTGSVNFKTADHHKRVLTFAAGGTIALGSATDAVPSSWCFVTNTGASQVALGAGIISAGGNTVATGQTVLLIAARDGSGNVRLYANTSLSNLQAVQTLSFAQAIGNQTAGNGFTVPLAYTNGTPSGLEWATARTGPWNVATGTTIADAAGTPGNGTASFRHPGLASSASAYTLYVRDRTNTSVIAVSNTFTVAAPSTATTGGGTTAPAPAQTITVATPDTQTAGVAFTVSGTYANGTPGALDVSSNGGGSWTAVSAAISGGGYSFPFTIPAAGSYGLRVRDRTTLVAGASGTFTVAAPASTGGGTTAAYAGPLDPYTSAWTMLYSPARRLRSAYTGPALRVRRSSDNVEADIGFNPDGLLNTTALASHVGAGNTGFVTKLYDQGGGGRDAVQSTAAKQPRIVVAGAVQTTPNGKPAIRFSGAAGEQVLVCGGLPAMSTALVALFAVVPDTQQYGRLVRFQGNGTADAPELLHFAGGELITSRSRTDGTTATAKVYPLNVGTPYIVDAQYTGTSAIVHVTPGAGLVFDEASAPFTDTFGPAGGFVAFGSTDFGSGAETYNGLIGEIVVSHVPTSGERLSHAENMRTTFGVAA